jgi:hypothetical protein
MYYDIQIGVVEGTHTHRSEIVGATGRFVDRRDCLQSGARIPTLYATLHGLRTASDW